MPIHTRRLPLRTGLCLLLLTGLAACNAGERLRNVGSEPPMTHIENPAALASPQPVAMPMPSEQQIVTQPNSLWRTGSRAFFKDQRASNVGDIVTVVISIDDSARLNNRSERRRDSSETSGLPNFLGLESKLDTVLPRAVDPANLVNAASDSTSIGNGRIQRDEEINVRIAALVTQVLPNGNLVIAGRQQTRVNYELRELQIAGLVRPEDITSTNTISYDQIAEARISYGGRGHISDVQQPRYGQQVFDIIWPF